MNSVASRETTVRQRVLSHLPEDFIAQLEFQRYLIRASAVLINNVSSPLQNSLVDLLELDLNSVQDRLLPSANLTLRIDLLSAKLRLYSAPLPSFHGRSVENPEAATREIWYKGFHVALQLAYIFTEPEQRGDLALAVVAQPEKVPITLPKHYFRVLITTTVYLITFIAIVRDVPSHDKTLARNRIKQIFEFYMSKSRADDDEAARTGMLVELLSQHAEDDSSASFFKEVTEVSSPAAMDNAKMIAAKIRRATPQSTSVTSSAEQSQMPDPEAEVPEKHQDGGPFLDSGLVSDWDAWVSNTSDIMGLLDPNYTDLLLNHWP